MFKNRRRGVIAALGAAGACALTPAVALAGPIAEGADCTLQPPLAQPFVPWADFASYALAPDGGLESGAAGWSLSGGAATRTGNERFYVSSADDKRSLTLPHGSGATTAPTCVGLEWPTIRFFTRSSGTGPGSALRVEVLYEEALTGATAALTIGTATPSGDWQPTAPMVMVVNALGAASTNGKVPVAYRLTPVGSGTWQVDDLLVDPWRGP